MIQHISIHALLAESDSNQKKHPLTLPTFLSTLSLRRATAGQKLVKADTRISIHALLAESDPTEESRPIQASPFLSTLSLRRATGQQSGQEDKLWQFLSTLSLRRATAPGAGDESGMIFLSTLSLRRATYQCQIDQKSSSISIHALLAESDSALWMARNRLLRFLSTLSLRRATLIQNHIFFYHSLFLSTLSLRRATLVFCGPQGSGISIHALLAESDAKNTSIAGRITSFLSTLSLRRATGHATNRASQEPYFYPRSPCGERLVGTSQVFQRIAISIHALLAESDRSNIVITSQNSMYFYPRSPCGERQ